MSQEQHRGHKYCATVTHEGWTVRYSPSTNYGYFERDYNGHGGGLWFGDCGKLKELLDYDGTICLPKNVAYILEMILNIIVADEFKD